MISNVFGAIILRPFDSIRSWNANMQRGLRARRTYNDPHREAHHCGIECSCPVFSGSHRWPPPKIEITGTPAVAAPKLSLNLGPGEADFLQALMSCERTETPERCERRLRREIKEYVDNSAGPQTIGRPISQQVATELCAADLARREAYMQSDEFKQRLQRGLAPR